MKQLLQVIELGEFLIHASLTNQRKKCIEQIGIFIRHGKLFRLIRDFESSQFDKRKLRILNSVFKSNLYFDFAMSCGDLQVGFVIF